MSIVSLSDTSLSRRLLLLQGNAVELAPIIQRIISQLSGDWIYLSYTPHGDNSIEPQRAKSLLGREFLHAVFDATEGFNLEAFSILAGTLKKGSILLLLLPENVLERADLDSVRWNESSAPISTPNFMLHLLNTLKKHQIIPYQNSHNDIDKFFTRVTQTEESTLLTLKPNAEQAQILWAMNTIQEKVVIVTAKRGRGKSALAGMFTWQNTCIICAPNKESTSTLTRFAKPDTPFFSPDNLLIQLRSGHRLAQWIIIDEAAMIPLPLLKEIIEYAPRILLLTTTEGYEGTGQGFLLKLLPSLSDYVNFTLKTPIRWLPDDPLECIVSDLLLEEPDLPLSTNINPDNDIIINKVTPYQLATNTDKFQQLYGLLKMAHYRTTPVDLRRLFDASNIRICDANMQSQTVGVILAIKEGGLTRELSQDIWLGTRRPKGNLVAQSLVAHAGDIIAAQLISLRINRIAVTQNMRRCGIGKRLVNAQFNDAECEGYDFVSVSFAYQPSIYAFWQSCGFILVHVGTHQEASSGCYAAMAIKPISSTGQTLTDRLHRRLVRNWFWLKENVTLSLLLELDLNQALDQTDWQALSGFAFAHRPYEASFPSICRLKQALPELNYSLEFVPLLSSIIVDNNFNYANYKLGKNAYIHALRMEIGLICKLHGVESSFYR